MNLTPIQRSARLICLVVLCLAGAPSALGIDLTITKTQDLSFGSFAAGSGGTVTISPAGARSSTGSVWLVPLLDGNEASFALVGDPSATYAVLLPSDGTVVLSGPGGDLALNSITSDPSGVSGQLNLLGNGVLRVGGTLTVPASVLQGQYSGSFSVTVNYN